MKYFWNALTLCLLLLSCQQSPECHITGRIKNVEDGTVISLVRRSDGKAKIAMSDTLRNGKFHFSLIPADNAVEKVSLLAGLGEKGFPSTYLDIYTASGKKIKVTGENKLFRTWSVKSNIKEQKYRNQITEISRNFMNELQQLMVEIDVLRNKRNAAESAKEKAAYNDSITILHKQRTTINDSIAVRELNLLGTMPVNDVWLKRMDDYASMVRAYPAYKHTKRLRELYKRLSTEQQESQMGQEIAAKLFPPKSLKAGDKIADGNLYDTNGNIHHLSDYEGKYLLIDFWGSACSPCRSAIPEMRKMSQKWKDKVAVISISMDEEKAWKSVSSEENITWINLNDLQGTTGIFAHYVTGGIPYYVIVSPDGIILHTWAGYGDGIIERKLKTWVKD